MFDVFFSGNDMLNVVFKLVLMKINGLMKVIDNLFIGIGEVDLQQFVMEVIGISDIISVIV